METNKKNTINPLRTIWNYLNIFEKIDLYIELRAYKKAVKKMADEQVNFTIANSSKEHATVIMCNIFRTANDYIKIFAEDLHGSVSTNEYISELRNFIARSEVSTLDVIIEAKPQNASNAIRAICNLRREYPKRVKIDYANDSNSLLADEERKIHFTFADDRMFRKEIDVKHFIAIADFNNPNEVKILKSKFESIRSTPLPDDCLN